MHLSDELLSAYLDGELEPSEATAATAHLGKCASCASALRLFGAVDKHVAASPVLSCTTAEAFLSAKLDGELGPEEAAMASAHLSDCATCRADFHQWSVLEQALAAMPLAAPSRRVDAAIAKLGAGRRVRVPRLVGAWPVPTMAVVTAITLILVLSLPQAGTPNVSYVPTGPVVAAVQQTVLNPRTGVLYVLQPDQGTVTALDSRTMVQTASIHVGGRPTALALNLEANTVLVLDASAKTVTEIEGSLAAVTSSTAVPFPGTPTSLQVDTKGNLVVTSVVTPTPGPSATTTPLVGMISMIDGGTKQVESVHQIDVAAQVIVIEPNGRRALLVSPKSSLLADAATYSPLASAPGGIAAAFAIGRDDYAVLSSGPLGAVLTFGRGGASLSLGGTPHAVAALPGGGYAVLTDTRGSSLISVISAEGGLTTTIPTAASARDLSYDFATGTLAVVTTSGATTVTLPTDVAAQVTPTPAPQTSPSPQQSASATPLPTPSATPATTPTPVATEPVTVVAPREGDGLIPANARALWPGTYYVSVASSQRPVQSITDGNNIWYLDPSNRVNVFHTLTGEIYQVASLPTSAAISEMAATPNHTYFLDRAATTLYVFTVSSEQLTSIRLPYATSVSAIAGSRDERLWLATTGFGLVSYDPRTSRIESVATILDLSAVATDSLGRVWTAGRTRQAVDLYDPLAGKLTEYSLAHAGSITALAVDGSDAVWVATDAGQTFALRSVTGSAALLASGAVGRVITDLVRGDSERVVYVSRAGGVFVYGPASGGRETSSPSGASEPMFDSLGRVWQADSSPAGGFYVSIPTGAVRR